MHNVVDLFLVYNFIKRLATPFTSWESFKAGIIDADGNILIKKIDRTKEQRKLFGIYDLMVLKLKKLLSTVPGGSTRIASYIAALWLIKEWNHFSSGSMLTEGVSETDLDSALSDFLETYFYYTNELKNVNQNILEDVPTMNVGSGAIAGLGVGPQGEPGLTHIQQQRHRRKAATTVPDPYKGRRVITPFMGEAESVADELEGEPKDNLRRAYVRRVKRHPRPAIQLT